MVRNRLEYWLTVYGSSSKGRKEKLETVQNDILWIILNAQKTTPIKEMQWNKFSTACFSVICFTKHRWVALKLSYAIDKFFKRHRTAVNQVFQFTQMILKRKSAKSFYCTLPSTVVGQMNQIMNDVGFKTITVNFRRLLNRKN